MGNKRSTAAGADSSDPFAMGLFGGLPRTATPAFETFTDDTTAPRNPSERATSVSGRGKKSSFVLAWETLCSHGDIPDTDGTAKKESSAVCSETRERTCRRALSDRLTPSLISAGLLCGTTPWSTRKQSGQPIQVLALGMPVGGRVDTLSGASSSSNAHKNAGIAA